jgi:deazaflavin-dependent oxidoreductase (nitroreductase family)
VIDIGPRLASLDATASAPAAADTVGTVHEPERDAAQRPAAPRTGHPSPPRARTLSMNSIMQTLNRTFGARMAASGRFLLIETVGRRTGRRHQTPVGFERAGDGALYVGAGSATAHWARNLLEQPTCRASVGGVTRTYQAEPLAADARVAALRAIQGRYGPGMADRIGAGPVFRLVPIEVRPD